MAATFPQRQARMELVALAVVAVMSCWLGSGDFAFFAPVPEGNTVLSKSLLAGADLSLPAPQRGEELRALHHVEGSETPASPKQEHGRACALGTAALVAGLAFGIRSRLRSKFGRRGKVGGVRAEPAESQAPEDPAEAETSSASKDLASTFCNLFAVWLAVAAICAVKAPWTFTWIPSDAVTGLLGALMFSVGITTSIDDFKNCLKRPGSVAINFISCYGIMPVLAYAVAKGMGASGPILAGLVLVGSINGGQASNLCTLIAGGDVALSVLMTTTTTFACIFMTPLICKLVLGTVVAVDTMGIVFSTFEVVIAPIVLGVGLNTLAPKFCQGVAPFTPVVGVIATVLLVGASVANCADAILSAGLPLQIACLTLHLFGGILGYGGSQMAGYDERTCRTVAIETAMKSSAFGFLLASKHFSAFNVRVPPAVSVVWMAITGSILAVYWKGKKPVAAAA